MTLKDLSIGDTGKIINYSNLCDKKYKNKLLSLGLTKNTIFKIINQAPLGDPIIIKLRNFDLSLRKEESKCINVEKI